MNLKLTPLTKFNTKKVSFKGIPTELNSPIKERKSASLFIEDDLEYENFFDFNECNFFQKPSTLKSKMGFESQSKHKADKLGPRACTSQNDINKKINLLPEDDVFEDEILEGDDTIVLTNYQNKKTPSLNTAKSPVLSTNVIFKAHIIIDRKKKKASSCKCLF